MPIYVTIETPYGGTPQKTAVPTATTPPPEEWVEIFHVNRPFGYNKTAFSFDLKNPPMVINVSLIPVNETGTKTVRVKRAGSSETTDEEVTYDRYSPYSWFDVTVRNKNTGQILLEDGFGNSYGKQYSQELNQTMKIINRGTLLIEIDGNLIAATVNVSVKKEGNLGNITAT
jgi:hypothetical protein